MLQEPPLTGRERRPTGSTDRVCCPELRRLVSDIPLRLHGDAAGAAVQHKPPEGIRGPSPGKRIKTEIQPHAAPALPLIL